MKWRLLFVAAALCSSRTLAATLLVPQQYSGIQSAVDAASPGDTVRVAAGTYSEHVELKDQVDVRGDNGAIVDATHVASAFRAVGLVHGVTVSGFIIQNAGQDPGIAFARGVQVSNSNGVTIERCTIANTRSQAVRADSATNLTLRAVSILRSGSQGILAFSSSVALQDSEVLDSGAAGARFDASSVRVMRTRFANNGGAASLRCHAGSVCHIEENLLSANGNALLVSDSDGAPNEGQPSILYSRANVIEGSRGVGIIVQNSTMFSRDDAVTRSGGAGVLVVNGSQALFQGLRVSETSAGSGLYAVSSATYCSTPECTSFQLQNTPVDVRLVGVRITGSFYNAISAAAGARVAVIDSTLTGNGTSGFGSGVSAQSVVVESVNESNDTTVRIPSSILVRRSVISGNAGTAAIAFDDSHLDLGVQPFIRADGREAGDDHEEQGGGRNTLSPNGAGSVWNFTANPVPAQGNWWGTADRVSIQAGLRDCATDGARGCVIFDPFLATKPDSN